VQTAQLVERSANAAESAADDSAGRVWDRQLDRSGIEGWASVPVSGSVGVIRSTLRSPGEPLDAGTRSDLELRLGQDFSHVRVHTDRSAAASARALGSRAYTVGSEVIFAPQAYAPCTADGRRLLAHELAHVAQQGRAGTARVDRKQTPDPLAAHISQADADAMTDDELSSLVTVVRTFLRDQPEDEDVTANLAMLESTMISRQAAGRAHPVPPPGLAGPLGPMGPTGPAGPTEPAAAAASASVAQAGPVAPTSGVKSPPVDVEAIRRQLLNHLIAVRLETPWSFDAYLIANEELVRTVLGPDGYHGSYRTGSAEKAFDRALNHRLERQSVPEYTGPSVRQSLPSEYLEWRWIYTADPDGGYTKSYEFGSVGELDARQAAEWDAGNRILSQNLIAVFIGMNAARGSMSAPAVPPDIRGGPNEIVVTGSRPPFPWSRAAQDIAAVPPAGSFIGAPLLSRELFAAAQSPASSRPPSVVPRGALLHAQILQAVGVPTGVSTLREAEVPYTQPPDLQTVGHGRPLDVASLDPSKRYLWVVDSENNFRVASEGQGDMFPRRTRLQEPHPQVGQTPLKHGDLTPGEGGAMRGRARAGGELSAEIGPDGPTGRWIMNNDSSYTFKRLLLQSLGGINLNAALELLGTTGTDTSRIVPANTHGLDAPR
jgi:hypothetical protein